MTADPRTRARSNESGDHPRADANTIRKIYDTFPAMVTKGDVDGIVGLYATDATIEDPVGSELRVGLDAIREFYEASAGTITMKRSGPVRVAESEAATPFIVLMGAEGEQNTIDIISIVKFNDENKIVSMKAYWSFDALRPATAADLAL